MLRECPYSVLRAPCSVLRPSSSSDPAGENSSLVSPDGVRIQLRNKKQNHILNFLFASRFSIPCLCLGLKSDRLQLITIPFHSLSFSLSLIGPTGGPGRRAFSNRVNLTASVEEDQLEESTSAEQTAFSALWTFRWLRKRRRMEWQSFPFPFPFPSPANPSYPSFPYCTADQRRDAAPQNS